MSDLIPDEADEALAKYGPDDLAFALQYAAKYEVDFDLARALERAKAREGGGGKRAPDHRRGRRG